MTRYLDLDLLLAIAPDAVGGEVLVRDYGLLESALARPRTTVYGEDAYPTIHEKAAALLHSSVSNHALVDGNKRLGWHACYVMLGWNGWDVDATEDEVVEFVVEIADGTMRDIAKIGGWLAHRTLPIVTR